jgi:hypothetical protein
MHRPVLRTIAGANPQVQLSLDRYEIPELQPLLDVGARIGLDPNYSVRWIEIDDCWQDSQAYSAYTLSLHSETNEAFSEAETERLAVNDQVLEALRLVPDLDALYLHDLPLSDAALGPVGRLRHLRHLVLDNVPVTDAGLRTLAECSELEKLWLQRVPMSGEGAAVLRDLSRLYELSLLSDCITQAGVEAVTKLEQLETLAIGDMSLASIAEHVSAMPRLSSLALVRGTLTRADMERLATSPHLRQLELLRVHLQGDALSSVADMPGLQSLFLARCEFDREALQRLHAQRPDLRVLGPLDFGRGPRAARLPERRRLLGGIPLVIPTAPAAVH